MALLDGFAPLLICFWFQEKVVKAAREAMSLKVRNKDSSEGSEQLACLFRPIKLVE